MHIPEGTHFNPYFIAGKSLAMAKPLSDDQVTYDDGSPQTVDQYARDVSAFLMWAAEPHLEDRKRTGFRVIIFLILLPVWFMSPSVRSGRMLNTDNGST